MPLLDVGDLCSVMVREEDVKTAVLHLVKSMLSLVIELEAVDRMFVEAWPHFWNWMTRLFHGMLLNQEKQLSALKAFVDSVEADERSFPHTPKHATDSEEQAALRHVLGCCGNVAFAFKCFYKGLQETLIALIGVEQSPCALPCLCKFLQCVALFFLQKPDRAEVLLHRFASSFGYADVQLGLPALRQCAEALGKEVTSADVVSATMPFYDTRDRSRSPTRPLA